MALLTNAGLKWVNFTTNTTVELGSQVFAGEGDVTVLLLVTGDFGTGSLAINYKDRLGVDAEFTTVSPITAATEVRIPIGKGVALSATLSGATAPDLNVGFVGRGFSPAG